jgi:hypothetical protein
VLPDIIWPGRSTAYLQSTPVPANKSTEIDRSGPKFGEAFPMSPVLSPDRPAATESPGSSGKRKTIEFRQRREFGTQQNGG